MGKISAKVSFLRSLNEPSKSGLECAKLRLWMAVI